MIDIKKIFSENPVKGVSMVGAVIRTPVKLKGGKKNPFQGRLEKQSSINGFVAAHGGQDGAYTRKVNRHLEKEGKPAAFEVQPRKWGHRLDGTPLVEHNGKVYLEIFPMTAKTRYFLDGEEITKEEAQKIDGFPEKPKEGHQGGLSEDNKVIIRTVSQDNIVSLSYNGNKYEARA